MRFKFIFKVTREKSAYILNYTSKQFIIIHDYKLKSPNANIITAYNNVKKKVYTDYQLINLYSCKISAVRGHFLRRCMSRYITSPGQSGGVELWGRPITGAEASVR